MIRSNLLASVRPNGRVFSRRLLRRSRWTALLVAMVWSSTIGFVERAQAQMMGPGGMGGGGGQGIANRVAAEKDKYKKNRAKHPTTFQNRGINSFTIAAVVDEQVILLEDVVANIRPELEARRRQMPPAQFQEYEKQRIQQAVRNKIQQTIVLNELRKKIPNTQAIDRIRQAASGDFEKYMNRVAFENKMKSRDDLVAQLKKEGTDIDTLRANFVDNMIAQQYLNSLIQPKVTEPTREDMEGFYEENKSRWSSEAGAIWRQIEVKKGSDAAAARQKIDAIVQQLASGADFAEVAKKQSQGPTAAAGGLWSRISKGSYADSAVDAQIFSLPVGTISPVIDGKMSYHVIRVEERGDGSPKPFVEVQEEIRGELKRRQIEKLRRALVDRFSESHHVETMFDEPKTETAEAQRVTIRR